MPRRDDGSFGIRVLPCSCLFGLFDTLMAEPALRAYFLFLPLAFVKVTFADISLASSASFTYWFCVRVKVPSQTSRRW